MFLISWAFMVVSLALASLIYYYVSIKGKAGDWGDGFKGAYFQLALRSRVFPSTFCWALSRCQVTKIVDSCTIFDFLATPIIF